MKKILIDIRMINDYKTGIGRYLDLVKKIFTLKENRYYIISNTENNKFEQFDNVNVIKTDISVLSLSELFFINKIINQYDIDIYHSFHMLMPFNFANQHVNKIVNIYDIITLRYPAVAKFYVRLYDYWMFKRCLKYADKIITCSEFSKKDILSFGQYRDSDICVVSPYIDDKFKKIKDFNILESVKIKYALPDNFLLYVGSRKPNKNLKVLVECMKYLKSESDVKLVIAGKKDYRYKITDNLINEFSLHETVKDIGYIDDNDLPALYNLAKVFVWPSKYEGFGIPILESLACGTPVVTTKLTSHPEVGQDAVVYFNSDDVLGLKGKIIKLLNEQLYYNSLIQKGYCRLEKYKLKDPLEQFEKLYREL